VQREQSNEFRTKGALRATPSSPRRALPWTPTCERLSLRYHLATSNLGTCFVANAKSSRDVAKGF